EVAQKPESTGFGLTEEQRSRIFGTPAPNQASGSSDSGAAREAQADRELEAFLSSLEAPDTSPQQRRRQQSQSDNTASETPFPDETVASHPSENPLHPAYDRRLPDGSLDIHPYALLPRDMSCRQAFDQAFYCQSLGGKFNDIYRYGTLKSCSEQWGAFWFCMRTRTLGDGERRRQIVEYYREREEKRRSPEGEAERGIKGGNSEDVWPLREKVVEKAFWRDPD
ncbi:hypothetical protein K431DRAFT_206898, partial [Polychaeton citri CBS 116435]